MSDSIVVRLESSDGEVFTVSMQTAKVSRTLATMLEDLGHQPDDVIPLPNVTSRLLKKVLAWIEHHLSKDIEPAPNPPSALLTPQTTPTTIPSPFQPRLQSRVPQRSAPPTSHTLTQWEKEFVKKNKDDVYELLLVANYLDIKALLDLLCQTVAGVIKGKDPEVIRRTFHASHPHTHSPPPSPEAHTPPLSEEDSEHSPSSRKHKETSV